MVMGGNIPLSLELEDAVRNRIRQMFFADLLQFPTDTDFTATEFVQRMQMRMQLLGPVMGRLEGELLARIVRRTYAILFRLNALPPMPPEIAQGEYTVEFVSPIALAQKQGGSECRFANGASAVAVHRSHQGRDRAAGVQAG